MVSLIRFHFQECAGNSGLKLLSLNRSRGFLSSFTLIVALVLLLPLRSEATRARARDLLPPSFWTIFVAFLYSFYALVTWPIRQLLRMFRRRKAYGKAQVKRVVIVGFDGMDPELASRFMSEGKLPNLAKLRDSGTFCPLEPRSPRFLRWHGPRFRPASIRASTIFIISWPAI